MAYLNNSKLLFFTTSPRSPLKMIPEINLIYELFENKIWDKNTQINFMKELITTDFFEGGKVKNLDFAARDRINRAPKSLGFIDLKPSLKISEAGIHFITAKNKEEILLRQLLKFQLPSVYHTQRESTFFVKPYLEIIRLIYSLGTVSFDEIMMFGLQLTDYRKFDDIIKQIEQYRIDKRVNKESYKVFRGKYIEKIVHKLYENEINTGTFKVRESNDVNLKKFIKTKVSTMRDYTDACFRYIRATGLVTISQRGKSLSIMHNKKDEVEYILNTIDRNPCFIYDETKYKEYLFNPCIPELYTDNKDNLIKSIKEFTSDISEDILTKDILELKEFLYNLKENEKEKSIKNQVSSIKNYEIYDEIMNLYKDIKNKDVYDIPLMLEWNTWRAMTMLNGGNIIANLRFDDNGQPMSTAQGNMADIVCDYGDFCLTVEVTTSGGARQYEMEGEPVARHLAKYKKDTKKPAFCLFIAPTINEACISYFFVLHKFNITFYEGTSIIVPVELSTFEKMLEDSFKVNYTPTPQNVKKLFTESQKIAETAINEQDWYKKITHKALNWLS